MGVRYEMDPTPRSDYDHWNEDRDYMWYQEVGRFGAQEVYYEDDFNQSYSQEFWEEKEEE